MRAHTVFSVVRVLLLVLVLWTGEPVLANSSSTLRAYMIAPTRSKRHSLSTVARLRGGSRDESAMGPVFVGTISRGLHRLFGSSPVTAWQYAEEAFKISDLTALLAWSFLPDIALRSLSNRVVNRTLRSKKPLAFEDTPYLSKISKMICQLGQYGILVYCAELLMVFLAGLGVPGLADKPKLLASFVYGFWFARNLSKLKRHLLDQLLITGRYQARQIGSRRALYNRMLDVVIYLITTLLFLDANGLDVGVAMTSLLTLGGVSSVVVGLALKDPVTEIAQGTSILFSDKCSVGDTIRLSDGTMGQVLDMRWTDVMMRGLDNSFVRIPYSQLAKSRVINYTRMPFSQFSQELKLSNRGADNILQLVSDIKGEIQSSCGLRLMDSRSHRFKVHWTGLDGDKAIVTVECHFRIPRLSDSFWETRQDALVAISRAVDKYNNK